MGLISMSPEEIAAVRSGFQAIISEFQSSLAKVVQDADNLASTWHGISYQSFVALMQVWQADCQKVGVEGLEAICTNMTTASTTMQETDADLARLFNV